MNLKYLDSKRIHKISFYTVIKIIIISLVTFYLFGAFVPYYEGADAFVYGVTTIDLFKGSFGFTNELLQESGAWEFVPFQWSKTNDNFAIPIGDVGIYGFTSISYLLGGYYGLFYLGPILTILFLIISERIATKLFGNFVGLLTLVFLATDFIILRIGTQLRNDNVFAIFFILGCFYLIKFFHDKKDKSILLCSIFFVTGTFIRINGIIAFPLEIMLILGYFGFNYYEQVKNESRQNNISYLAKKIFLKILKKDFLKKTSYLLIPWIIFFIFMLSFNQYYYGDPLTNYFDERPTTTDYKTDTKMSFFKFDSSRFTWLNFYSIGFLPDIFSQLLFNWAFPIFEDGLGTNPLGTISFLILLFTLIISLYYKEKRIEVVVATTFILGTILFYSAGYLHSTNLNFEDFQPSTGTRDRYMISALPLFLMIFSLFIYLIWKVFFKKRIFKRRKKLIKGFKKGSLSIIAVFLIASLFYSTPVQGALKNGINFNNPEWFVQRFPLDSEGLSKQNSIIVEGKRYALEFDAILFFPYWGYWHKLIYEYDPQSLPQKPIEKLKHLLSEGYDVYAFRDPKWNVDSKYFRYLAENHGLVLKNYSNTFCKFEQTDNVNLTGSLNSEFDKECYQDEETMVIITMPVIKKEGEYISKKISLIPPIKTFFNKN